MTRWILVLALASAVSGCMRGCSCLSSPADTCDGSSDCREGTCQRGYCVDEAYARLDNACHAGSACAERGDCAAVQKVSFLGLKPGFECAAATDQDCRQSQRCATHEECAMYDVRCVRNWTSCPALPSPEMPGWATPVDLVWDYDSLRTPWQPGDVASATLACRIEGKVRTRSMLRIAGRCAEGPKLDASGLGRLLRVDVALHVGDAIAVAVQDGPIGKPSEGSFAQVRYEGASPLRGGRDREGFECVVVSHDVGLARSLRELAAVDRQLKEADGEQPYLASPRAVSYAVEAARVHAGRAALWLGWRDPELAARVQNIDAAAASWLARLDTAIRALAAATEPIRTTHLVVAPVGRVCGAALPARGPSSGAGPTTGGDTCAFELAIDNTSDTAVAMWPASAQLGEITELLWLRPAHDGEPAEIVPATIVEIRAGATMSTTEPMELPPGQHALVLVGGFTDGAVLHGRIAYGGPFALRP